MHSYWQHCMRVTVAIGAAALLACTPQPGPTPTQLGQAATRTTAAVLTPTAAPPTATALIATAAATRTPAAPAATATPGLSLVAGQWTMLFYHPGLEQVVLVNGGPDRGKAADDPLELWAWDGAQWTLLSADPDGPRWRNFASAAFDTARQVLVLHGGVQSRGVRLDDTWEWDGQTWTQHTEPGPGPREGAEAAYDAARGQLVVFGGATTGETIAGDTWAWDGAAWTQVATSSPAPRFPITLGYDAAREVVLLYGGHYVGDSGVLEYSDLWAWDGAAWRELSPASPNPGDRIVTRLVFDPMEARVLLFAGGSEPASTEMWAWDGAAWSQRAVDGAPLRSGMGSAYDPGRDVIVAFGGVERPGGTAVTDTWEWDRQTWRCVHGCE
jgi:hypothetical protein